MSDLTENLVELCAGLREAVQPFLGRHAARAHAGRAVGGDVTFEIDEVAERFLEEHMRRRRPRWAYYSEDRGLQGPADPELVLVVDPIDGTRPAAAGLESACVSVAAARPAAAPTLADVVAGVVQEIKGGDVFVAERGDGLTMRRASGAPLPLRPSPRTGLEGLFWMTGLRGRPLMVLAAVLEELVDETSVSGSVFELGSATYAVTRVLTGQLDAYVDIGPAIVAAYPAAEREFRRVGRGQILCNSPYDLAAAYLLCLEAGVPMTDADGGDLASRPLLGSGAGFQIACIVAGNAALQAALVERVQRGLARLPERLPESLWSSGPPNASGPFTTG
ncbi:MAG TPA: inositol monophosphatase family protein [Thermoleophilia bacterium]|nr:inositol monophosphatase family protein [Thermoleophilia bacterium]